MLAANGLAHLELTEHLQCDEQRPCRNCVRFNIPCSLVQSAERASIPSPSGSSNRGPESPRAGPSGTSNHPPPSTARSPVESGDIGLAHDSATWLQSLRLLHHYNTVVSMELSDEPRTNVVWTRTVPELAFANVRYLGVVDARTNSVNDIHRNS